GERDAARTDVGVVAGQDAPPDREAERLDCIAERTELRRHGERVDDGGAVSVQDDPRVRYAEASGLLEQREHSLGERGQVRHAADPTDGLVLDAARRGEGWR